MRYIRLPPNLAHRKLRRNPLGKRVIRTIGGQKSQDALRAQLCLLSQLSRISLSFAMTSGYKQTEMERRRHLLRMYGEKKVTEQKLRVVDAFCKGMDLTDIAHELCVQRPTVGSLSHRCASS